MTPNDQRQERSDSIDEGSSTDRILPLVRESGNRKVLKDWIEKQANYDLVPDSVDILTADYDCLIVDTASLLEQREALLKRIENEDIVLPVILLVEESEERQARSELRGEHPALSNAVNSVVTMPISEYRFADQLRTLIQMREQSREIATQQAQLRAIRDEHAGHGVVITDREGTIQYVNKAFEQQSGYSSEEVIGENPRILQSGEHDESFYEELWNTILAGEVWQGEVVNERKDGQNYVLNQTIAPVTGIDGEIERFIAVNHEITQLKELETSLRSQSDQLEILNRILRHDIRNDLNVIIGWLDVLEDHVEEEGEDYIDRVTYSASHIVELTEEAGDLVEDITTEGDPDLEQVAISSVLEEEVAKRREAFNRATIEFEDELPPETEVWANSMLKSVFRNLINNAIQHNDSDDPRVEIHSKIEKDSVIVTVADNGPGIPDTEKQQIFVQAEKGLDSEGTGMGLFLVHSLVDTFGGEVRIEDNEPSGSIFIVELPLAEDHSNSLEGHQ
jgi:PAS domain S-box-containing protein